MDTISKIEELPFIKEFKMKLRKKAYDNSTAISITTTEIFWNLIKTLVEKNLVTTFNDLLLTLMHFEKVFISIDQLQFSIGNIIKRILFIVREEETRVHPLQEDAERSKKREAEIRKIERKLTFQSLNSVIDYKTLKVTKKGNSPAIGKVEEEESVSNEEEPIFSKGDSEEESTSELKTSLSNILDNIAELKDELDIISEAIKSQALDYIQDDDIILTSSYSGQLEEFFIEASKTRKFKIIVAESAPSLSGITQTQKLLEKGIDTKVISDNAVFAVMPKINKVIIGTRAIIANGGLISYNGAYNLCLCAHTFSIPVIVVGGTFKLTPSYPFGHETINEYLSPDMIYSDKVEYSEDINNITFNIPVYDYVPPELITIYITNHGSQNPKNIYRLFSELYSQEDYFS